MEWRPTSRRQQPKPAKPPPRVVAVLAGLLERAAERGDAHGGSSAAAPASFRGRAGRRPEISVRRYAERIYRYAGCSPACFVVAYAYLDRLAFRQGEEEVVDSRTVHRLLITSVMVAAKFMDDVHHNNAYFARVGGVEVAEMNGLELDFLFALRFRLNVTPDAFASYCAALEGALEIADVPPSPFSTVEEEGGEEPAAVATRTAAFAAATQRVAEITQ